MVNQHAFAQRGPKEISLNVWWLSYIRIWVPILPIYIFMDVLQVCSCSYLLWVDLTNLTSRTTILLTHCQLKWQQDLKGLSDESRSYSLSVDKAKIQTWSYCSNLVCFSLYFSKGKYLIIVQADEFLTFSSWLKVFFFKRLKNMHILWDIFVKFYLNPS